MQVVTGDLWAYPADLRVITTNGSIRKDGRAVMGRGCAREAKDRYLGLDNALGRHLNAYGNHVFHFEAIGLATFPVKVAWQDRANLLLIERSAIELCALADRIEAHDVVLPRPGCGHGYLKWTDVCPVLEPLLNDRFHVIAYG